MHALMIGPRGVGKSCLISGILKELDCPVFGFYTKKEDALAREDLGSPIYIYDTGTARIQKEENLLGYCKNHRFITRPEAFDRWGPKLLQAVPEGGILVMDELGFMESEAKEFCAAVLQRLDGRVPVLAAVKDKDTAFLDRVRSHKNAVCFYITEENREDLFQEVLQFLRMQLGK